jgi:hypothetical protein
MARNVFSAETIMPRHDAAVSADGRKLLPGRFGKICRPREAMAQKRREPIFACGRKPAPKCNDK